jgi:pimeloyl-ACP methyl ester carboxylesterase
MEMDDLIAREILSKYKRQEYRSDLDSLKKDISRVQDARIRGRLFDKIFGALELGEEVLPPKVFVILHGIRTRAEAQSKLVSSLKKNDYPDSFAIQYEFLNAFKFWVPFFIFRKKKIKRVLRDIRDLKKKYQLSEFTVFAHSFGTYVISKILEEQSDLTIENLVLCGAIISDDYDWSKLPNCPDVIINDCGTRDIYPVLAKGLSFGYGTTGRFGFGTPRVTDRFHDFGHSDFFEDDFIEKYWQPFFVNKNVIESEWTHQRPTTPLYINYMASKWFYAVCLSIVCGVLYLLLS